MLRALMLSFKLIDKVSTTSEPDLIVAKGVNGLCFQMTNPLEEEVPTISDVEGKNLSC